MYPLDKVEVVNCITPKGRGKWHGEIFELLKALSKVKVGNIVDDIQKGHTGTCVTRRLALEVVSQSPKKKSLVFLS